MSLNSEQGKCASSIITPPYIRLYQESDFNLRQTFHYNKFNSFCSFSKCASTITLTVFVSESAKFSLEAVFLLATTPFS